MTYRWRPCFGFTDVGMYVYIEEDSGLHSIAPFVVRAWRRGWQRRPLKDRI